MFKLHFKLPHPIQLCYGLIGILILSYIGIIAVVMSYAALTVEFTQSMRNDTSAVAQLEKQYLSEVARITAVEYTSEGYAKPKVKVFVRAKSGTAIR
jgi:hypothetical protein